MKNCWHVYSIFQEEEPENELEAFIDGNLKGSYPLEEVFKVWMILTRTHNCFFKSCGPFPFKDENMSGPGWVHSVTKLETNQTYL